MRPAIPAMLIRYNRYPRHNRNGSTPIVRCRLVPCTSEVRNRLMRTETGASPLDGATPRTVSSLPLRDRAKELSLPDEAILSRTLFLDGRFQAVRFGFAWLRW